MARPSKHIHDTATIGIIHMNALVYEVEKCVDFFYKDKDIPVGSGAFSWMKDSDQYKGFTLKGRAQIDELIAECSNYEFIMFEE